MENTSPLELDLFGEVMEESWKKEWWGMPEFEQEDLVPFKEVVLRFDCQEDVDDYCKLTGATITPSTTFVWFPEIPIDRYIDKRWVDAVS